MGVSNPSSELQNWTPTIRYSFLILDSTKRVLKNKKIQENNFYIQTKQEQKHYKEK